LLGLVIVNVMKHSPWATSTVFATIPAALIVGLYCGCGVGAGTEGSLLGVMLMVLAAGSPAAGSIISPCCARCSDYAAIALGAS